MADPKFDKFEFENDFFEVSVSTTDDSRPPRTFQEAQDRGFRQGLAEGHAQAQNELSAAAAQHTQAFNNAVAAVETSFEQFKDELQAKMLGLMRHAISRITGHAARHYPDEILESHLRAALDIIHTNAALTLRISPEAQAFHEKLQGGSVDIGGRTFSLRPDPSLNAGDCVVEWEGGGMDAKLGDTLSDLDTLLLQAGAATNIPNPPPTEEPSATPEQPATDVPEENAQPEQEASPETPPTEASTTEETQAPETKKDAVQPADLLDDGELIDELKD